MSVIVFVGEFLYFLRYGLAKGCSGCDCFRASNECATVLGYLSFISKWSSLVRSAAISIIGEELYISYGSGIVI